MITASHNLGPDNGIQLVDPKGEMLETAYESVATKLANCKDVDTPSQFDEIVKQFYIPEGDNLVVVGRDPGVSSPALSTACLTGIAAAGWRVQDIGVVTTPQPQLNTKCGYGEASIPGYYDKITRAFKKLLVLDKGSYRNKVVFDGPNVVGAPTMSQFKRLAGVLEAEMVNTGK